MGSCPCHGASNICFCVFFLVLNPSCVQARIESRHQSALVAKLVRSHWYCALPLGPPNLHHENHRGVRTPHWRTPFPHTSQRFPKSMCIIITVAYCRVFHIPMEYNGLAWECRHYWRYGILCLARNANSISTVSLRSPRRPIRRTHPALPLGNVAGSLGRSYMRGPPRKHASDVG